MKTLKSKLSVFIMLVIGAGSLYAQEYDDMYFSAKDRKKVKTVSDSKSFTQDLGDVKQFQQMPEESYSARNVNPEYIAKYQAASRENASAQFADNEYFVENPNDFNDELNQTVNNFATSEDVVAIRDPHGNMNYFADPSMVYWSDPWLYRGSIFDPLYRGSAWNYYNPLRYRVGWGARGGVSWGALSGYSWQLGGGFGWQSNWGFGLGATIGNGYNTWNGLYSPFYDPFWGGYCPPAWGWSPFGYNWNRGWSSGVVIVNNYETRSNRTYRRGAASSRSSNAVNSRRNAIVDNDGRNSSGRIASNTDRRNFDDAQSRYYRRSRSAVNNSESVSGRSSGSSRSSAVSNYTPNSRTYNNSNRSAVSRSSSENSRSSYSNRGSSYSNSRGYNRSTQRGNSNYSRPSNSRSGGYTPSRSSSGRSSGYSSGSSRSRSSGVSSGSRSSSGSSGTRSSGRSSGSSRRGNN